MIDASALDRVAALQARLADVRKELRLALAEAAARDVDDYVFRSASGRVCLSALFAGKRDLIVIHNMGVSCPNCTMWADGFNGLYPHLADRAAFAVSSPDAPERQAAFAADRGWRFPMVSHAGTSFAADMGFTNEAGRCLPGLSAFRMEDGRIRRVSASRFEPQDDFCPAWHMFGLLEGGVDGWRPRHRYGAD
jgi:predicted dithiol-disulfide oxidoreductase (DUF899 family)